jgi:radical SAM protein with 4Fe4S-binding SPASM domain
MKYKQWDLKMDLKLNAKRLVDYYHLNGSASLTIKRAFQELGMKKKEVMPLPPQVNIEPTTLCNFNCVFCARKNLAETRKNKYISNEHFVHILDSIPSVNHVGLLGFGEPLMTPNMQELIDSAKSRKIRTNIVTNGSLLNVDRYTRLALQFDELITSLDTPNRDNYKRIRVGGDFDKTIAGMKKVNELKKQEGNKHVFRINFTATHLNYTEIPQMKEICLETGVDSIAISELMNWYTPSEPGYAQEAEFCRKTRSISNEIRQNAAQLAKELKPFGIHVIYTENEWGKATCTRPFAHPFISLDGYVTPCCRRQNPDAINFGNVFEEDFADIWNNEAYRAFRRTFINNTPNPICDACPD